VLWLPRERLFEGCHSKICPLWGPYHYPVFNIVRLSFVTFKICSTAHLSADASGESAQLWRANVKIQLHNLQGNLALSHYIYLGSKQTCNHFCLSIHLSNISEWMRSFFTQQTEHLFWKLSGPFYGTYLFSNIQSKWKSDFRKLLPQWESNGSINVIHMQLKRLKICEIQVTTVPIQVRCEVTALISKA